MERPDADSNPLQTTDTEQEEQGDLQDAMCITEGLFCECIVQTSASFHVGRIKRLRRSVKGTFNYWCFYVSFSLVSKGSIKLLTLLHLLDII